jgi:hypothetical protein
VSTTNRKTAPIIDYSNEIDRANCSKDGRMALPYLVVVVNTRNIGEK